MNFNLIKCVFGLHKYSNPIKDEILNRIVRICIWCNETIVIVRTDGLADYNRDKLEIINDINLDNLCHAKQKLDILLKRMGY